MGERTEGNLQPLGHIGLIEAEGNYTRVHVLSGRRFFLRRTLKDWLQLLPSDHFFPVHRTAIVNLSLLRGWRRAGPKEVVLDIGGVIPPVRVSRRRWTDLRAQITLARPLFGR